MIITISKKIYKLKMLYIIFVMSDTSDTTNFLIYVILTNSCVTNHSVNIL